MIVEDFSFLVLVLNSFITVFIGCLIGYNLVIKKLNRHTFYYFWALGFILYGIQIGIRNIIGITFEGTLLVITAFSFFLAGIWSLQKKIVIMFLTFSIYIVSIIMAYLYFSGYIQLGSSLALGATLNMVPVVIAIIYHRSIFGRTVDKLALGWIILLLSNILFWDHQWTLNIIASVLKIVILFGILEYDFIIIGQKISRNHSQLAPIHSSYENGGTFRLVLLNSSKPKNRIIEWVNKKTKENVANNITTYVFCFQDIISYKELWRIKWLDPNQISIFLFSSSANVVEKEFEIFPIDLAHIGLALTELIRKSKKTNKKYSIIFLDLSVLIHLFGEMAVYKMLLDKMGSLRESQIELFGIFHPETHKDPTIFSLFKNISDDSMDN